MLIQFLVENYASIKSEQILSLVPSTDKEHPENINIRGKSKALNTIAIYGANASGKSSLYKALTTALIIIRSSNIRQVNDAIPVLPFKFDNDSGNKPSRFEFTFIADDEKKYVYGYSATFNRVCEEYLYRYNSSKASLVFERKDDNFSFSRSTKAELEPIIRMNTSNKLFIATATAWNTPCTTPAYKWLSESIDSFTNDEHVRNFALDKYRQKNEEHSKFAKELLKQADINISNISVESKKIDLNSNNQVPALIINGQIVPQEHYQIKITTGHTVKTDKGERTYQLSLNEESLGTQQLFYFSPILKETLDNGKILVVDELDRSMHPFIVKFLVDVFRNKNINKNNAQLIFTTHETSLLSLNTFRRDQIYFTEKNSDNGVTDLYSLDDFSVRKDENIEKGYLLGRYGAIPYLHTEEII